MHQILCSSGSIIEKQSTKRLDFLRKCRQKLRYDGIEMIFCDDWYETKRELVQIVTAEQWNVPAFHCDKHLMQNIFKEPSSCPMKMLDLFRINCEIAAEINAKLLILHLWNGRESDFFFERQVVLLPHLISISQEAGMLLTIENVICSKRDPISRMIEIENMFPEVCFTFDIKMAAFHGQLEETYQEGFRHFWEKSIKHVHLCDYKGGIKDWEHLFPLPIGKGTIDFDRFFELLDEVNYDGDFTVESVARNGDGTVDFNELNRMYGYIRKKFPQASRSMK